MVLEKCGLNISEMVGTLSKNQAMKGQGPGQALMFRYLVSVNDEMTCEFEADASKFVTEPRLLLMEIP
jgi:hypothetical protein